MIGRFSSRTQSLTSFLPEVLAGATAYDRIAGYFSSSMLEIAGEAIDGMSGDRPIRIICNSDLAPADVYTAKAAQQAMLREWKQFLPEDIDPQLRARLDRLHRLLRHGRLKVKVMPDGAFGLLHGKAGVITRSDGSELAFIGSANETLNAWKNNYEIVWTDESTEGVSWVRNEFEALWRDHRAFDLADGVVKEIERVSRRSVVIDPDAWRTSDNADAEAAIELPIYQRENGLWAHQKWFVQRAFELHKLGGARLVLADQVGLGKTVQLALAAKLMLLQGDGNVLAIVPKPLLHQWQDELWDMLRLPSAIWTGKGWEDENEVFHPAKGAGYEGLRNCPRRFGLISGGLVKQVTDVRTILASMRWDCVIVDEAHHARRSNTGQSKKNEKATPNNMLSMLQMIAPQSKSMLLATATPVQIDPIEAFDLLEALNRRNEFVLGGNYSQWLQHPRDGLAMTAGAMEPPEDLEGRWQWMRDPFPLAIEDQEIDQARRALGEPERRAWYSPNKIHTLSGPDRARIERLSDVFFEKYNPYILHIVRRTREFLENEIDPGTNEPYLPKVEVRLFGEAENESINLPGPLADAYEAAQEFCKEVGQRPGYNRGFLETMLLRRVGSTIIAGRKTATKMLGVSLEEASDEDEMADEDEITAKAEGPSPGSVSALHPLSDSERQKLENFLARLDNSLDDPKYQAVETLLLDGTAGTAPWLELGCIIFSQYFDSAQWIAERLSSRLPEETIAVYAGSNRSGLYRGGGFTPINRDEIKSKVRSGELRLVIGTDAASEGLNLQRLGTLINLDLPWNPTRLEQRKGRIQRIGQPRPEVYVYNMRYRGSVEDRVHELLSDRLEAISGLFGQLPDTLEDVWVAVAQQQDAVALQKIAEVPERHPFEIRYDRIENVDWESCSTVLDNRVQLGLLRKGW